MKNNQSTQSETTEQITEQPNELQHSFENIQLKLQARAREAKENLNLQLPNQIKNYTKNNKMMLLTNLVLIGLIFWSGFYVVDLNNNIRRETDVYGKGQEEEIRLNQDFAELQYRHSQAVDIKLIEESARKLNMREPDESETIILQNK